LKVLLRLRQEQLRQVLLQQERLQQVQRQQVLLRQVRVPLQLEFRSWASQQLP
jgi:hypothetical protein